MNLKNLLKKVCFLSGFLACAGSAFAADNLPIAGQTGIYLATEATLDSFHFETKPTTDTIYKTKAPSVVLRTGYGNDRFQIGILGGAVMTTVKNAFDQYGDFRATMPLIGVDAKMKVLGGETLSIGLVGDAKYIFEGSDTADFTLAGSSTHARMKLGPLTTWSAGVIGQWQPAKHLVVFAGEKYDDISGDVSMEVTMNISGNNVSNSNTWKVDETKHFSTVAGVVAPMGNLNLTLQGKYKSGEPIGATLAVEYRF